MPGESAMLSLSDIVNSVVEEIVDGVHRAQIAQDEDARELEAIAALDPA